MRHSPDPGESMVRDPAKAQGKALFDGTSKCQEARESTWGGDSQGQAIGRVPGNATAAWTGQSLPLDTQLSQALTQVWVQASKGWKTESKLLVYNLCFETTVWVAKLGAFYGLRSYRSKWRVWGCFLKLSEIENFFLLFFFCNNFEEETLETKSWLLKF